MTRVKARNCWLEFAAVILIVFGSAGSRELIDDAGWNIRCADKNVCPQAKANLTRHVVIYYSPPRSVWLTADPPKDRSATVFKAEARRRTPSWKIRIAKFFSANSAVVRKNPFMVRQAHHERDGAM